ncbi:hypothetical protein [Cellulophaga fucicola]|uniref:hypothetical protein n=1 Tax=Cellulophaga fucicola TaxID=76595 RepID=UPI003EB7805F
MKKKIFSIGAVVLFASASLSANQNKVEKAEVYTSCSDIAFMFADAEYDRSGDGFAAAEAYDRIMSICQD